MHKINPAKNETQSVRGNGYQENTDTSNSSQDRIAAQLMARLALAGHHVSRLERDGFLVSQQSYCLHCPTLENLAQFAKKVGAAQ